MVVDDSLTNRFYDIIGSRRGIVERKMMGGICFMLNGNMLGGADRNRDTGHGRFMFRVGKDNESEALALPDTVAMEQGGRPMSGMVFINADSGSDSTMQSLARLALQFVNSLPVK